MLPEHVIQYVDYRIDNAKKQIAELESKFAFCKLEFEKRWYARLFRLKYTENYGGWTTSWVRQTLASWLAIKTAAVYQQKMGYEKFDCTGFNEFHRASFYEWCIENKIPWNQDAT